MNYSFLSKIKFNHYNLYNCIKCNRDININIYNTNYLQLFCKDCKKTYKITNKTLFNFISIDDINKYFNYVENKLS